MEERIQKLMAEAGIGSRRDCEALIEAGRVTVNGHQAQLGEKADPGRDTILVDGQVIKPAQQLVYIALYKPRGVISAVESPDPRPTVRDIVPVTGRVYPVGRLDVDSEGLILLTNDGELANRLTHPRYGHEKEYRVLVARKPDEIQLDTWRRGVVLEDGYRTQPADVRLEGAMGKGAWLRIILREGRKRQIRETGTRIGLPVVKIIRVRIGSLTIGSLRPREWRYLTPQEVAELKGQAAPATVRMGRKPAARPYKGGQAPGRGPSSGRGPGSGRQASGTGQTARGRRPQGRGAHPDSGGGAAGRFRRSSAGRWEEQNRPGDRGRPSRYDRASGSRREEQDRAGDHSQPSGRDRPGGWERPPAGKKPGGTGRRPSAGGSRPPRGGRPAGGRRQKPGLPRPASSSRSKKKR